MVSISIIAPVTGDSTQLPHEASRAYEIHHAKILYSLRVRGYDLRSRPRELNPGRQVCYADGDLTIPLPTC